MVAHNTTDMSHVQGHKYKKKPTLVDVIASRIVSSSECVCNQRNRLHTSSTGLFFLSLDTHRPMVPRCQQAQSHQVGTK